MYDEEFSGAEEGVGKRVEVEIDLARFVKMVEGGVSIVVIIFGVYD